MSLGQSIAGGLRQAQPERALLHGTPTNPVRPEPVEGAAPRSSDQQRPSTCAVGRDEVTVVGPSNAGKQGTRKGRFGRETVKGKWGGRGRSTFA